MGLPPPVVSATAVVGQGRMDEREEVVVDMRAEVGLPMVRHVVETRQLANIGMFSGEPMARKAGN